MFGGHHRPAHTVEEDEEQELMTNGVEEEEASRGSNRKILVGVLAVGAVVALGATLSPSGKETQLQAEAPRFLESDDLLDTIAAHAVRFQHEMGGEVVEGDHEELKGHARRSIAEMAEKVSQKDLSSGRLLKDLNLNDEQWYQSKQILEALHNKKVQDLGNFVQSTMRSSGNLEEAASKVAEREDEFRALRDQFVPPDAQDVVQFPGGENHWSMGMSHAGQVELSGSAAGWSGSLSLGGEETARRLMENATADRRLMTKQQMVYLIVTAVVVGVLGIVLTILTATLGAQAATVLFLVGAGLDGILCAGSVGLTFIPGFKNFNTWIPCVILSSFTGLEAIWTFRKPRCSHTCPNGGKVINNRCFFMVAGTLDFATAQSTCSARSATLASVRDSKDIVKIQQVLTSNTAWLGASRTCPPIQTAYAPAASPKPAVAQKPASCTAPFSWTDGTAWFAPSTLTQANTFSAPPTANAIQGQPQAAVTKPCGYQNLQFSGSSYVGAFDTDTTNALCELWMCR